MTEDSNPSGMSSILTRVSFPACLFLTLFSPRVLEPNIHHGQLEEEEKEVPQVEA